MSNASVMSLGREGLGKSEMGRHGEVPRSTSSKRKVNSATAVSPLLRTSSTMGPTVPRMEEKSTLGRAVTRWSSSLVRSEAR